MRGLLRKRRLPVEHDGDRRGGIGLLPDCKKELFAIGGRLPSAKTRGALYFEQSSRRTGVKRWSAFYVHSDDRLIVGTHIVQLAAVASPTWRLAAAVGDLPLARGLPGHGNHIHFVVAAFIRLVCDPARSAPPWGEPRARFVGRSLEKCDRLTISSTG